MPRAPQLLRLIRRWQDLLNLENWKFSIRYVTDRSSYIYVNENLACGRVWIWREESPPRAEILILHPSCYTHDVEETVVHELIHVLLPETMETSIEEERAINCLARVLVQLRRTATIKTGKPCRKPKNRKS